MIIPSLNHRPGFFPALTAVFVVCLLTLFGLSMLHAQGFLPTVRWETDLNAAMARAEREQRPLFLHFVSNGDPSAQQMEREVFVQPNIVSQLNANFVMVRINASENAALVQQFSVTAIPTDLIIKSNGQLIHRRYGVISAEKFANYLTFLQNMIQSERNPVPAVPPTTPTGPTVAGPFPGINPAAPPTGMPIGNMPPQRETASASDPFGQHPATAQHPHAMQQPMARMDTVPPTSGNNQLRVDEAAARPTMGQPVSPPPHTGIIAPPVAASVPTIAATLVNEPAPPKMTVEVPLALEGCCPVTLCAEERWIPGNPAYCVMYQGHLFRFASLETLTTFAQNPAYYMPIAMGEDIVLMADRNKRVNGSRDFGACYQGRVFLFANQETFNAFAARPGYYAEIALKYEMARKEPSVPLVY